MLSNLLSIATNHKNLIAVQRAKRALRIRYGIQMPRRTEARDPVWLTAHGM